MSTSQDSKGQYIPIMNAIFAAQKAKIPIDVVRIGGDVRTTESTFLQQASYTTNGVYTPVEASKLSQLPQYLVQLYAADQATRAHLVFPKRYIIILEVMFMIGEMWISEQSVSVIDESVRSDMSAVSVYQVYHPFFPWLTVVFCQRYERCSTCGTKFDKPIGGATPFP